MHNTLDVKKPVSMTFTFDLTRRAFFGLGEFFLTHVKAAFSFPHCTHKPMFHRRL
jgi:hypothetical protein